MYSVQNLTNRPISFQGATIAPYGSATFAIFTDYITLAKLSNSGKIRYSQIQNQQTIKKDEIVDEKIEITEDKKVDKVVDAVVEETCIDPEVETEVTTSKLFKTTEINSDDDIVDITDTISEVVIDDEVEKTTRNKKRSKKNNQ